MIKWGSGEKDRNKEKEGDTESFYICGSLVCI